MGRGLRVVLGVALGALVVAACSSPLLTTAPPGPSTDETAEPSTIPLDVANAMAWRTDVGLRADEPYVRALLADPLSVTRARELGFEFPLTAQEADELSTRLDNMRDLAGTIVAYGEAHPHEWAGLVVDPTTGRVTAQFRGHLPIHQAAIERLVLPGADFEVVLVRASREELQVLVDRVVAEKKWLRSIGAPIAGYGVDEANNVALIDVYSEDQSIGAQIIEHFDAEGLMTVRVKEPRWDGGWGNVDIVVSRRDGGPLRGVVLQCERSSETPRVYPSAELVDRFGQCGFILEATTHLIEITREVDGQRVVVGRRTITLERNQDLEIRIKVDLGD